MRKWSGIFVLATTLILLPTLLFDWWPALRGGFGWQWPYAQPDSSQLLRMVPGLGVLAVILAGFRLLRSVSLGWWVAWSVISATALPIALLYIFGNPLELLFLRTISGQTTGGFAIGSTIQQPWVMAREWPMVMPALIPKSIHIAISPPGWPMLYSKVAQLLGHVPGLRLLQRNNYPERVWG